METRSLHPMELNDIGRWAWCRSNINIRFLHVLSAYWYTHYKVHLDIAWEPNNRISECLSGMWLRVPETCKGLGSTSVWFGVLLCFGNQFRNLLCHILTESDPSSTSIVTIITISRCNASSFNVSFSYCSLQVLWQSPFSFSVKGK